MKVINVIILCLFVFSCKSQENVIQNKLEESFKEYVLKVKENQSKEEVERYLNNEAKFILESRRDLFSNIKIENNTNINMVEFFDKEMSTIYSSLLEYNSKYYFFQKNVQFEKTFKEVDFIAFKKEHPVMACVLLEMKKPKPNKLTRYPAEASYHHSVYITTIDTKNKIQTYIPNDICILNDASN